MTVSDEKDELKKPVNTSIKDMAANFYDKENKRLDASIYLVNM